MTLYGGLNVLSLNGGKCPTFEDAALASACIHRNHDVRVQLSKLTSNPFCSVEVLAEDDAAVLKPGLLIRTATFVKNLRRTCYERWVFSN